MYAGDQLNHLLEIQRDSVGNNECNKLDHQLLYNLLFNIYYEHLLLY